MTNNHDLSGKGKPSLRPVDIPVVDNHAYVIALQHSRAFEEQYVNISGFARRQAQTHWMFR